MSPTDPRRAVPLALVHHANQYLITDGYDNREGLSELVEGYAAVLRLHEKRGVPINLHLSGTLIEAVAWHHPWFLALVRDLRARGLLALIGGTYSESVMTLCSPSFNLRQLGELLRLYRQHLDCPPEEVRICWVPERVWDTGKLAPVLADRHLANGGYRFVLLDDRLLYPTGGRYFGSPRARFDAAGPYGQAVHSYPARPHPLLDAARAASPGAPSITLPDPVGSFRTYRIAGTTDLAVVPISANLRYWVPPAFPDNWRRLEQTVALLPREGGDDALLVYADDLEKVAGVGPWDVTSPGRYDAFLRWFVSQPEVEPILLPNWLAGHPPREVRDLEPGTYFELAQTWGAGESYRRWWESAAWLPYREQLEAARDAIASAEAGGADRALLELAWKQFMACSYETGWQDPHGGGESPAPWARALASHSRATLIIAEAARWFARADRQPLAVVEDVDRDGEAEVILANEALYAVLTPTHGGRLIYLFTLAPRGGVLVVGNPADDWNWQEELNRFMDQPPNHPGALAEVGFERDRYQVAAVGTAGGRALVELANAQEESPLFGARKSVLLSPGESALLVTYRLPGGLDEIATEACLSPDYHRLLLEGRSGLSSYEGETWHGFRNRDIAVWLALDPAEETSWAEPARAEVGHGLNLRVRACGPEFHLLIGCGEASEDGCRRLLQEGKEILVP